MHLSDGLEAAGRPGRVGRRPMSGTEATRTDTGGSGEAGTEAAGTHAGGSGEAGTEAAGTHAGGSGEAGTEAAGTHVGGSGEAGTEELVHRRIIEYEVRQRGDGFDVVGRLQDQRPWAGGTTSPMVLHSMELQVTVQLPDLVITDAAATMHRFPHAECRAIEPAFAGLVGLSVARGYTREVQRRFGGALGCSHLEHLARSLGPVVIQAVASARARARAVANDGDASEEMAPGAATWMRNTCHIWADGGIGEQKVAIGWRPGRGAFPAPPLEELRTESPADGPRPELSEPGAASG